MRAGNVILSTPFTRLLGLANPVLSASGALGYGAEVSDLAGLPAIGAFITPTITLEARSGWPPPRVMETAAGLIHAVGCPNAGLEAAPGMLAALRELPCPAIVSIGAIMPADWAELARAIAADRNAPVALELNLDPGALWPRATDLSEVELLAWVADSVRAARSLCAIPIIAKLPGICAGAGRAAASVQAAGADVVAVSHAYPAVGISSATLKLRFAPGTARLSGPAILPLALRQIGEAARTVSIPVVGGGGITSVESALQAFAAGADGVSVGSACYAHPAAAAEIADGLAAALEARGFASLEELKARRS